MRPFEKLSTAELGDLWSSLAANGRELEKQHLEDTIKSLDEISVDEESDKETAPIVNELFNPFPDVPDEVSLIDGEEEEEDAAET
jgi:hypothetical protein